MGDKQRTLAIIKPDAVAAGHSGHIISLYEKAGFAIVAMKKVRLTLKQAEGFYAVHRKRPFFKPLCKFMSSGPCLLLVLEAPDVIARNRQLMGATDSRKAAKGTIRRRFGTDIQHNAVHGSDAPETAAFEISYFFNAFEFVE
jgi:nucleoside-diphosphate kinase